MLGPVRPVPPNGSCALRSPRPPLRSRRPSADTWRTIGFLARGSLTELVLTPDTGRLCQATNTAQRPGTDQALAGRAGSPACRPPGRLRGGARRPAFSVAEVAAPMERSGGFMGASVRRWPRRGRIHGVPPVPPPACPRRHVRPGLAPPDRPPPPGPGPLPWAPRLRTPRSRRHGAPDRPEAGRGDTWAARHLDGTGRAGTDQDSLDRTGRCGPTRTAGPSRRPAGTRRLPIRRRLTCRRQPDTAGRPQTTPCCWNLSRRRPAPRHPAGLNRRRHGHDRRVPALVLWWWAPGAGDAHGPPRSAATAGRRVSGSVPGPDPDSRRADRTSCCDP